MKQKQKHNEAQNFFLWNELKEKGGEATHRVVRIYKGDYK